MTLLRPVPIPLRFWISLALALLCLGTLGVLMARKPLPPRVLLLAPSLMSQGGDLGPGLETLLSDTLEVMAGATLTHAPSLPPPEELKRLPSRQWLLRCQAHRVGDGLGLRLEWNTVAGILAGQPWTQAETPVQEPRRALEHAVGRWPLPLHNRHLDALVPRATPHFWMLLEGLAIADDRAATEHLQASQRLVEAEPSCATAWVALGDHLYRSMWVRPDLAGVGLSSRTHRAFQRAVDLVPGHPRGTFLGSLMLTDTGNQSLALQSLQTAMRLRPGSPDLYLGIAYAGRTSGLLEISRRALARRAQLMGPMSSPSAWFAETTYLYLGDREAFRQELARAGAHRQNADIFFYKGYGAMLQGQSQEALGFMISGAAPGMSPAPFQDLCRVYRAYLEGRHQDGLKELRRIDEVRGKLHIPDGEWTFKEAEAYALLGDADRGMDCATRAFVQGFSCAAWFEGSPFLERARQHPRWPMLRRNIRERQAGLEGSFPPQALDP